MVLSKFAFNESMYIEIAQHLFYWDVNEGTNQPRDMKSSFRDDTPFVTFTSNNRHNIHLLLTNYNKLIFVTWTK